MLFFTAAELSVNNGFIVGPFGGCVLAVNQNSH